MLLWSALAAAEGLDTESQTAVLSADTRLYVEILSAAEIINWTGEGGLTITGPDASTSALAGSGAFSPSSTGTWRLELHEDQPPGWDVTVSGSGSGEASGRVFSYLWQLSAGSEPIYDRFYVPVPLADSDSPADGAQIFKIYTEGVRGESVQIAASRTGLNDSPGYSGTGDFSRDLPLFLERPDFFSDAGSGSTVSAQSVAYDLACEQVIPGYGGVLISMSTATSGQPIFICDLDQDNVYDISGYDDLAILSAATPEDTAVYWDGYGALGEALSVSGELSCSLGMHTSPMHALVHGATVASPGIRLFTSETASYSPGRSMVWNDRALESTTETADGTAPLIATRASGIFSDNIYTPGTTCSDATGSDCDAHGWGAPDAPDTVYGAAWVDTWTFDDSYIAGEDFPIHLADLSIDYDSDGLPSAIEDCLLGTAFDDADTDHDGLGDSEEVGEDWESPLNHDDDELIDALDDDDDGDDVGTAKEITDTAQSGVSEDVNGDGTKNWHDTDADGDGIPDGEEALDDDGNGIPDYLEAGGQADTGGLAILGSFQGGVCQCAARGGSAGLWIVGLVMMAAMTRRQR
jgi:hypothetical protein